MNYSLLRIASKTSIPFFEILFDTIPCNASWESTSEFQDIFKNWVHSTYLTYTQSY